MRHLILLCLLTYLKTFSQKTLEINLHIKDKKSDFFILNERSLNLSNKKDVTFQPEKLKKYLVFNFPTNDYKRFVKDYKAGNIPDSIFKLTIDKRKIDLSDFKYLENDDILEVLVAIDLQNNLIVVPNANNNATFDDDSVYQYKLNFSKKQVIKIENIKFKNIDYHLGDDSLFLDLFTNLKIHLDENDFEKTKIYIYNDTYYTGKFNINDTTFQLNVSLIAGGLDFKYKYDVEYQLLSDFDKNDKLYNTYLRTYKQGDSIRLGYYIMFLDSIDKFGSKAYLSYKKNNNYYTDSSFFSNLTLSNIIHKDISTPINIAGYKIIDFWTSWCLPCLEQHNFLEANYNAFKGKNVSIIGINVDSLDSENSKKYLKRRKLPWNNFSLFNSTDANKFPISIYPTYVLLSPNNSILLISNNIKNIFEFMNKL